MGFLSRLLFAAAVALVIPSSARAAECTPAPPLEPGVAFGFTGGDVLPANARPAIRYPAFGEGGEHLGLAQLTAANGEVVEATVEVQRFAGAGALVRLSPSSPLVPGGAYTLSERLGGPDLPPVAVVSFQVDGTTDSARPQAPVAVDADSTCRDTCDEPGCCEFWDAVRLDVYAFHNREDRYETYELRDSSGALVSASAWSSFPALEWCSVPPAQPPHDALVLEPETNYTVRVVDIAGNASDSANFFVPYLCGSVSDDAGLPHGEDGGGFACDGGWSHGDAGFPPPDDSEDEDDDCGGLFGCNAAGLGGVAGAWIVLVALYASRRRRA